MLFLSDASMVIFLKFLQILLWISIPAFVIGMIITTLIHYKNKKKKNKVNETSRLIPGMDSNEVSGFDDFSLVPTGHYLPNNKYEMNGVIHQLFHSKARYFAIRKDFEILNEKYQKLHIQPDSETIKQKTMETIQRDIQENFTDHNIENIKEQYELEKKQLHSELSQLNSAYETLERENASLQEQLNAFSNDGNKVTAVINKWELEKAELKKRITEQEYLKDVVEEKKLQINFLQQQLEQRIKNHHMVEQQFRDLGVKFMEINEALELKQQSEKEYQGSVHDKEQEITFLKEIVQSKTDQTTLLENSVRELQEQNKNFSIVAEDNNKLIDELRLQLENNVEQKKQLAQKLERSQTYFKGLHRKLSDIIEEDIAELPVIVMKQVFTSENAEQLPGSAAQ
jgi:hypothetical protein